MSWNEVQKAFEILKLNAPERAEKYEGREITEENEDQRLQDLRREMAEAQGRKVSAASWLSKQDRQAIFNHLTSCYDTPINSLAEGYCETAWDGGFDVCTVDMESELRLILEEGMRLEREGAFNTYLGTKTGRVITAAPKPLTPFQLLKRRFFKNPEVLGTRSMHFEIRVPDSLVNQLNPDTAPILERALRDCHAILEAAAKKIGEGE